ncbi:MAG TPA: LLM class flavin-dependent oxidoreductase [Thermomicrobiaceae bacterium]|nr:LLM class flavin-dependent oxidoreductase [Thermomicrobiaceae bacterium]
MKVGFILRIGEPLHLGRPPSYREIRQQARQVEQAGFDSLWVHDHLLFRFPDRPQFGVHECWSILGGLAEATERVELGTLVICALWRDPALLAKMAVTMDEVSGGRFTLGLGAGGHEPEFTAFGYPFDHLASRFEEALQIIVPLLRDGEVDFRGRYYRAPNCALLPRGPRPGGPPVLVAGRGPRMLRLAARYADQWNAAWFGCVAPLAERRAAMGAACRDVGRDPDSLTLTVGVNLAVGAPAGTPIDPDRVLSGTAREIAEALSAFEAAGVPHVLVGAPYAGSPDLAAATIDLLGDALARFRRR